MKYTFEEHIRHITTTIEMYQSEWNDMIKFNNEVKLRADYRELVNMLKSYNIEGPNHYPDGIPFGIIHKDVRSLITVIDGGLA